MSTLAPAFAQLPSFGQRQAITSLPGPGTAIFAADLDGDGDLDAMSAGGGGQIACYPQLTPGVFGAQIVIHQAAPAGSTGQLPSSHVTAADIDLDGLADVAWGSGQEVGWKRNLGGMSFGPAQILATNLGQIGGLRVRDLTGDNKPDIAVAAGSIYAFANTGLGTVGTFPLMLYTGGSNALDTGDLDGDGDIDMVTAEYYSGTVRLHINAGQLFFTTTSYYLPQAQDVAIRDVNSDQRLDIVSVSRVYAHVIQRNNGSLGFTAFSFPHAGGYTRSVSASDFNNDGDLDIVVGGPQNGDCLNENNGSFSFSNAYCLNDTDTVGLRVHTVDLDGDGDVDIMTTVGGISWRENLYGVSATATPYGAGCGTPALTCTAQSMARIGQNMSALVGNAPSPLCVKGMGWSRTYMQGLGALPFSLNGIGMLGCFLHQSAEIFGLSTSPTGAPGVMLWSFAVPLNAALVGADVFTQAFSYSPTANPFGLVSSNGIEWRIGT